MRALFALLLLALSAHAFSQRLDPPPAQDPLPYSLSGDYAGDGYLCRLENGPFMGMWSRTLLSCIGPDSVHYETLVITWGCPSTNTVYPMLSKFVPFDPSTDLAIRIVSFGQSFGHTYLSISEGLVGALQPPATPPQTSILYRGATLPGSGCGTFPATSKIEE